MTMMMVAIIVLARPMLGAWRQVFANGVDVVGAALAVVESNVPGVEGLGEDLCLFEVVRTRPEDRAGRMQVEHKPFVENVYQRVALDDCPNEGKWPAGGR